MTKYRLKPDSTFKSMKWLQFESTYNFLFWRFKVWRYIPESWVAGVFSEKKCPWLYLPFISSHCYICFFKEEKAKEFIGKNPDIATYLKEIKYSYEKAHKIIYL